jgi:excisionase family DNA binding protein
MSVVAEHTLLPPSGDFAELATLVTELAIKEHRPALLSSGGVAITLPEEVAQALREVVAAMAEGRAITIAPHDTVLSTQAAAEMLGVSRPTLVRILESGELAYDQPARHRRVKLADLLDYRDRVRRRRRDVLDEMSKEAADDGAHDAITGFVTTR